MKVLLDREVSFYEIDYEVGVENDQIPVSLYYPLFNSFNHIALILYGGSPNFSQMDLKPMKDELAHNGIIAASFDYRGNTPKTKQEFFKTGLATRIEDARSVIKKVQTENPTCGITLIGISMGGYIATHCLESIKNLILIAPAAYQKEAVGYPFGSKFSTLIKMRGFEDSDAFEKINFFEKSLLVIQFEKDEIVPPEIPQKYIRFAATPDKTLETLKEYGHKTFSGKNSGKKQKDILIICFKWLKTRL